MSVNRQANYSLSGCTFDVSISRTNGSGYIILVLRRPFLFRSRRQEKIQEANRTQLHPCHPNISSASIFPKGYPPLKPTWPSQRGNSLALQSLLPWRQSFPWITATATSS